MVGITAKLYVGSFLNSGIKQYDIVGNSAQPFAATGTIVSFICTHHSFLASMPQPDWTAMYCFPSTLNDEG